MPPEVTRFSTTNGWPSSAASPGARMRAVRSLPPPGLYGIARKDRSASTAVSAGAETFPVALIEGAAQAWAEPDVPVVVAFADDAPPAVYRSLVDTPRAAYAVGVRLAAGARQGTMRWEPSDRDEQPEAAPAAFRACVENGVDTAWHGGGRAWHWTQHGHA